MIAIVAAVSNNGVIGSKNKLPWRLKSDLRDFKAVTDGHTIVMGRRTYESIGHPLPGRRNIVLTKTIIQGVETRNDPIPWTEWMREKTQYFVIGGERVYRAAFPYAYGMRLTVVDAFVEGDAHFPWYDDQLWRLHGSKRRVADEENQYNFSVRWYLRATKEKPYAPEAHS